VKTKLSLSLAAAALAALMLAGCSSASPEASPSPSPTTSDAAAQAALQAEADAALAKVEWAEDDKGVPTVTFDIPFNVGATAGRLIQDGDGAEIAANAVVTLDYTVTSGTDGTVAASTYDEGGVPEAVTLADGKIDPILVDLLVGAHVGADFLYAAADTSSDTPSSVIMAVTVSDVIPSRAEGTAVAPVAGLPVVTLDDATGKPSIEIPKTDPPKDLVAQTLIKGDGKAVAKGDSLTVQYTGWLWDGTQFDSSWDRGAPATFTLEEASLIKGWVEGLPGQTVGSQVLLVIPPALGYGDDDSQDGTIPGGSTLVFVIDILAAS
jgi:peptidylprolyl isomerase